MNDQHVKNFPIVSAQQISAEFLRRGIGDFQGALRYIRHLPYGRNTDKHDLTTVFADNRGTCSTKHAVLKQLAMENHADGVALTMGLFRMSPSNTPAAARTISAAGLDHIPEAHCYLKVDGERVDVMSANSAPEHFVNDLIEEQEIMPGQIANEKVIYHREFLQQWLYDRPEIPYTLDELWAIREQCIRDLEN